MNSVIFSYQRVNSLTEVYSNEEKYTNHKEEFLIFLGFRVDDCEFTTACGWQISGDCGNDDTDVSTHCHESCEELFTQEFLKGCNAEVEPKRNVVEFTDQVSRVKSIYKFLIYISMLYNKIISVIYP